MSQSAAAATLYYPTGTSGIDVSYPNCSIKPITTSSFEVVGVNNGLNFSENPCFAKEASWNKNLSLYMNTGYPGASSANAQKYMNSPKACAATDLNCIAYDYGYNAALYSLNLASNAGLNPSMWWLDVETANSWETDTVQNQNALQGFYDAITSTTGKEAGVYSTTAQWGSITNAWQNNWPNWGATTVRTAKNAATFCTGHQFTGGPTYLIQYQGKVDQDYAC